MDEVARYERLIEEGEFGTTVQSLSCQILCEEDGTPVPCIDGRNKLANGKRMNKALKNKFVEYKNAKDSGKGLPSWAKGMVLQIFEQGRLGQHSLSS